MSRQIFQLLKRLESLKSDVSGTQGLEVYFGKKEEEEIQFYSWEGKFLEKDRAVG